jgi:Glycosyltransferase WbsX
LAEPRFVAYVYPGWHPDPYRPGVDEWELLDGYRPRFAGQEPPPRPLGGPYRDDTDETAARQAALAADAGIEGFTYFLYFKPDHGLVLDQPMRRMIAQDGPAVAGTWCIRLPHDQFPVAPRDHMELPDIPAVDPATPLEDRPIEALSMADLEELLGRDDRIWSTLAYDGTTYRGAPRTPAGPDSVTPPAGPTVTPLRPGAAAAGGPDEAGSQGRS